MEKVYFKLYKQDGTAISTGNMANPLEVVLNATNNEEKVMETTLKAETGFVLAQGTTVSVKVEEADSEKYFVSLDNSSFTKTVTIEEEVDDTTGVKIYVKATSSDDEEPSKDTSTKIKIEATVQAK